MAKTIKFALNRLTEGATWAAFSAIFLGAGWQDASLGCALIAVLLPDKREK